VVLEAAYKRVLAAVPAPDDDQALGYVRTAAEDLAGRGFVEVNEMMSPARLPGLLGRLEGEGALPIAVRLFATPDDLPAVLAHFREHGPSERIRMGGMKLFLDGSLNSRTAWMLGPYADPLEGHPRGTPMVSPEELDGYLALCQASHMDCATHAIGDAAVRMALDAYERIGSPTFRLRIEHAQFIDEADVGRFAALGVVASMQPCHLLADVEAIERLLPHRADRAFALRDLVDAASSAGADPGDLIELGSDAPVVPPEPRDNLQAAVRRGRVDSGTVGAGQAITESECWGLMRARG
jgi:predicted amidohydrolase YtcJ